MKYLKNSFVYAVFFSIFVFFTSLSFAGSSQSGGKIHYKPEVIVKFAKKVEKILAEKGARVAIIARVGRPRSDLPEGINYTHTAFAVYSQITTNDGRKIPGYSIYNLYQRDKEPDASDLIKDFPIDFFAGVELLEAGIIIPTPELQKRLLKVLVSPTYKKLHNPNYSVIANPFTSQFQNCTEHTLDIVTAAIYETDNLEEIKNNEKAYYKPQKVNVNPIKLLFGSMFTADVATSDHQGVPETATFTSIGEFLNKFKAASEILTVSL